MAGVALLLLSLRWLWRGGTFNDIILVVTAYDGCCCDECLRRSLGISLWSYQVHVPFLGRGDAQTMGVITGLYALTLLILSRVLPNPLARLLHRHRDPNMCPNCNYPRLGLVPGAPCPECGVNAPL